MAIERARRAIWTASVRRSSRSTVMTMSAASEEALAPRAPIATPTSARARAGASLSPSPTITIGPEASDRSAWTASTFSDGTRSARTASTPMADPMMSATAALSPVTITIRVKPIRRSERIARGVSGRSGSSRTSAPRTASSIRTKAHVEPSIAARRRTSRAHRGSPPSPAQNSAVPTATRRPSTAPITPAPGVSTTSSGIDSVESPFAGSVDDRTGEHVRRQLLDRGRQPEDLALIDGPGLRGRTDVDRGQPRPAGGERPGLVEQHDASPRQRLERTTALDDHAAPRGA